jgi:hypothetical protein
MASTFGWTLKQIRETTMEELTFLLEGSQKFGQRQEKAIKQQSKNKPGKRTIDNINQLPNLPGVRTIRRKK